MTSKKTEIGSLEFCCPKCKSYFIFIGFKAKVHEPIQPIRKGAKA